MRNFREYHVWKNSHELVLEIYKLISTFPDNENYGIKQQMRRAAYSIPSNFAEGCGRDSDKDFNRLYKFA